MEEILTRFIIAFLAVSVFSLVISVVFGRDERFSRSSRGTSCMAFFIGIVLLYLRLILA